MAITSGFLVYASSDVGVDAIKSVGQNETSLLSVPAYFLPSKKEDNVTSVRVTIWGAVAEAVAQNGIRKYDPLFVSGTLEENSYTTKDGEARSELQISVNNFGQFVNTRHQAERKQGGGTAVATSTTQQVQAEVSKGGEAIPF